MCYSLFTVHIKPDHVLINQKTSAALQKMKNLSDFNTNCNVFKVHTVNKQCPLPFYSLGHFALIGLNVEDH